MKKMYKEFCSVEESKAFWKKAYGKWLYDFQFGKKLYMHFPSTFDDMNYCKAMFQSLYGCDFSEKYEESKIYEAFSLYCGNYHNAINESCRYGTDEIYISNIKKILCEEILKFKLTDNIITYRSLEYADLLHSIGQNEIKKGDIFTHKGFLSTGLVLNSLLEVHNYDTVLKLYVPIGCNAVYLDYISHRSKEQELLLLPDMRLKTISNKFSGHFSKRKRFIECEVLC